jgi:gliding motility-associated protein GldC
MSDLHTSEITLRVGLDDNRIPEKLTWSAQDGGIDNEASKAIMLSVWDHKKKDTLRMDLWTKDMPVDEMKQFYHQTLVSMADTFGFGLFPQPSSIIRMTFLFIGIEFNKTNIIKKALYLQDFIIYLSENDLVSSVAFYRFSNIFYSIFWIWM